MRVLVAMSATGILIIVIGIMFLPMGWFIVAYIIGGGLAMAAPTVGVMGVVERRNK